MKREGSLLYRFILLVFGLALQIFFRRIETVNADRVPTGEGVIFVMNHPNGLIDPALVFVALPRRISFLAKSTLFRMPVIGWILRTVDALPVYRRIDAGEDITQNQKTFEMSRELLAGGGSIALFPEGVSHNSPKMLPLKTGAARIALGAASAEAGRPLDVKIVPVGLFYTSKTTFRSEALLHFGELFSVSRMEMDKGHPPRDAVRELTQKIETSLREVTLNAENESELHTARVAEAILSSARNEEDLGNEFELQRDFLRELTANPADGESDRLSAKVRKFNLNLDSFGIEPQHLSLALFSRWSVVWESFKYFWKLLVLLPFAALGAVLHFPAYQICKVFSIWYARHGADDVASTVKMLAGIVFMPMTWLIATAATFYFWRSPFALLAFPIAFLLGYAALYTLEEFEEARGWARAIVLFLTRREKFLRFFVERRELQKHIQLRI